MDPLSVAASAIAVATLATQVGSTILKIRARNDFKGRLEATRNEITDVGGVLRYIAGVLEERKHHKFPDESLGILQSIITRIELKLRDLDRLLTKLLGSPSAPRKSIATAAFWLKEKANIQLIQQDIRAMKGNLGICVNTSIAQDSMRIRLDLRRISISAEEAEGGRAAFQKDTSDTLLESQAVVTKTLFDHQAHFDQRFDELEEKWIQSLGLSQYYQALAFERSMMERATDPEKIRSSKTDLEAQPLIPVKDNQPAGQRFRFPGVRVQAIQYNGQLCKSWCPCDCHSREKIKTPKMLDQVIGQLFVGYAGLPYFSRPCNKRYCERKQTPFVAMDYYFPSWWMTHIVKMTLAYQPMSGPQFNLSTLRRVPDTAQCFLFAMEGDIEGVKSLLIANQASTKDVAATTGYTMLTWAVIKRQANMAEFLLKVGSDPYHDPSGIQPTPSDLAWDVYLRGVIPKSHELSIRSLLHHSDYVDEQNFPLVHKIIIGLSLKSLDDELSKNPDAPFEVDAQGRTALSWAACRGDALSCAKLIAKGANVNALDKHLKSPLYLTVNSEHSTQNDCVRVLLEGGAETDPVLENSGVVRSTPLLCSANEAEDILVLKTLLDFGANIEATNRNGETPLLIVARRKPVTYTALLLAYGANVRARDKAGRSVLATAIKHNNHDVLKFLLDRWFRYITCPRLRNLDVLHVAAEYADLETLQILIVAGHWGLRADFKDIRGLTAKELMRGRLHRDAEIEMAFEGLIRAVDGTPTHIEKERMMEAGLLENDMRGRFEQGFFNYTSMFNNQKAWYESENDEVEEFEDAVEVLSEN